MRKLLLLFLLIPFGFSLSFGQNWLWGIEGGGSAEGFAGATDNEGNAFVGGQFQRKINFNTDTLKSLLVDLYFVKYDKNGNFLWAVQSHCSSDALSEASAIGAATDKSGNVYVTGAIRDTVYLGANRLTTPALEGTAFLAKYGVNGNLIWVKQAYAPTFTTWGSGLGVVCDKLNNVYVTGGFGDTLIFGTDTLKTTNRGTAFFLVKYDSNGKQLFARQSTAPAPSVGGYVFSASMDGSDNIYLTGYFHDSISIKNYVFSSLRESDFFTCKYDSAGILIWAKQGVKSSYNNNNPDYTNSIAADKYGNSYITGQFIDTLYFDTIKLASPIASLFIAKYDKNGHALWAKKATSLYGRQMFGFSIAASDYGKVYVSGSSGGNDSAKIQIENFIFQQKNITDGSIVLELDTAGNVLCGSIAGTGGDDENIIACDPSGQYVYLCGDGDPAIFGSDTLLGSEAPLIARWQPCDVNNTASAGSFYYPTESISVYPNPNNGKFTIQSSVVRGQFSVEVYNILGEQVYSKPFLISNSQFLINLSNQPNGVYLYRVISQDGSLIGSGKVLIEK